MKHIRFLLIPAAALALSACSSRYAYNESFEEDDIYYVSSDPDEYDYSAYMTEQDAQSENNTAEDDYYSEDYDDGGDTYINNNYGTQFGSPYGSFHSYNRFRPFHPTWGYSYNSPYFSMGYAFGSPMGYNFYNNYYPFGYGNPYNYGYSAFGYPYYGNPWNNTFYCWNDPFWSPFYGYGYGYNSYCGFGYSAYNAGWNAGYWNGYNYGGGESLGNNSYYGHHGSISGNSGIASAYGNGGMYAGPRQGNDPVVKDPSTATTDLNPQKGTRPESGVTADATRPSIAGTSARDNNTVSIVETRPTATSLVRGDRTLPSSATRPTQDDGSTRVRIPSAQNDVAENTRQTSPQTGVDMGQRSANRSYSGRTSRGTSRTSSGSRPSYTPSNSRSGGTFNGGSSQPSRSTRTYSNPSRSSSSSSGSRSSGSVGSGSRSSGSSSGSRSSGSTRSNSSNSRGSSSRGGGR